ncbi:hypothetical protein OPV22_026832 [Ensete ventricosum]|uniref:Calnexin n=1 Tax=Ensete ventricosum TaxID=4639 RepID=A0AAV8PQN6_ENSVE|nr:hypothetical protein OPV22_026832 [Ensete ventricosum]
MAVPFLLLLIASSLLQISASDPLFYESSDEPFEGWWIESEKDDYQGLWKHSKSDGHEDYGLLVSEKARKYAIVKELDESFTLKDGTVVLPFEIKCISFFSTGIQKTGKFVEHHLKYTPTVPYDKPSHVYTAILKPVPDPDDKKPENWDERAKIPDSDAVKPDDWDEDASMEIEDEEAVKPERWLDDEPEEVDDNEATKPEDWDDEDDGEWEAPKIDNPKCEAAPGCGEWKRPTTRNSGYKGK